MADDKPDKRLPSFSDFSPHILDHDIRSVLQTVKDSGANKDRFVEMATDSLFGGKQSKRASVNVPATLGHTGLVNRKTWTLTEFGEHVLGQPDAKSAAKAFVKKILLERNGLLLLDAIATLYARRESGSRKALLKRELEALGIEGLSNATTDHTTLENWLVEAGIVIEEDGFRKLNESGLRDLIGIESNDLAALLSLTESERLFLEIVRRTAETRPAGEAFPLKRVYDECLSAAPALFVEDRLRQTIVDPLERQGWIKVPPASSGKGGLVKATQKLLDAPLDRIAPGVFSHIPADLRPHLMRSIDEVRNLVLGDSDYEKGLGLELLALRMLLDIGLMPRAFRRRARDTSYAEVDLLAEGKRLIFSRWVVQCKNQKSNVGLSDIAKEVGVAVHQKAHVVLVITSGNFTSEARKYSDEITRDTHLQVVLVPGTIVQEFLAGSPAALVKFLMNTAERVMQIKAPDAG